MRVYKKLEGPFPEWNGAEAIAYEVRVSYRPEGQKWRSNAVVMVVANCIGRAIEIVQEMFLGKDPLIDQAVTRSRAMTIVIDDMK